MGWFGVVSSVVFTPTYPQNTLINYRTNSINSINRLIVSIIVSIVFILHLQNTRINYRINSINNINRLMIVSIVLILLIVLIDFVFCCFVFFFPSILDINGRTSRGHTGGRSHRIFNPPSFCGARLDFCREKDSAIPFPRRP